MPRPNRTRTEAALRLALAFVLGGAALAAAEEPKAKAAKPDADPVKLTIKWSTSSEVDNYGFWVMRSDKEKGPFKEANAKVIPGAGNSELPRKYSFEDRDVQMGKTYYYYLEAVSTQGHRETYSPVMAKQCCDRGDTKAPEAREIKDPPAPTPATAAPAAVPKPDPEPSTNP